MKFRVAESRHEPALRALCRADAMPGWIRLAYAREPNYFHGAAVQGTFNQVLIAEEADRVVGVGCRSIKPAWVNGVRQDIGYLSGLRLSPEVRRTGTLARAYAACKLEHDRHPAPAYLTTVLEGNTEATRILTSGRAGLPHYLDCGRYLTYAINLNRRARRTPPTASRGAEPLPAPASLDPPAHRRAGFTPAMAGTNPVLPGDSEPLPAPAGAGSRAAPAPAAEHRASEHTLTLRRGDDVPPDDILSFLNQHGARRQFFPALEAAHFGTDYLRGLRPADFRVAVDERGIAGVAAVWDQSGFKQNTVTGYAAPIQRLRSAINVLLRLTGFSPLPAPGEDLRLLYVSFACVRDDDPAVLRALLESICAEHQHGYRHFLVLGFHERDPLRAVMSRFLTFRYVSRLYLVCWDDGLDFVKSLDPTRIPYLDAATL